MNHTASTATLTRGLPQAGGGFSILLAAVGQLNQTTSTVNAGMMARGSFRPASEEGQDGEALDLAQAASAVAGEAKGAGPAHQPVIAKLILPQAIMSSTTSVPSTTGAPSRSSSSTADHDQKGQTSPSANVAPALAAAVVAAAEKLPISVPTTTVPANVQQQPAQMNSEPSDSRTTTNDAAPVAGATENAASAAVSSAAANAAENVAVARALNTAANVHTSQDEAASANVPVVITNRAATNQTQQAAAADSSQSAVTQSARTTTAPSLPQNLTTAVLPDGIFLPNLNFTLPAGSPNGDLTTLAAKSGASKTGDMAGSKDNATINGQSSAKSDAFSTSGTSQASTTQSLTQSSGQDAQNGSQTPAHTQSDGGAAQAATLKAADGATSFVQLQATAHQAGQDSAPVSRGSDAGSEVRADSAAPLPGDGQSVATGGINTAKLIQTMNETGMQVGMRSPEFGDISIRTSVSQQQMMTQISVDHAGLGQAISAHIPGMQAKLGDELGLHASIELNQSGAGFTGERGYSSQQQQQQAVTHLVDTDSAATAENESPSARVVAGPVDEDRLDIRA